MLLRSSSAPILNSWLLNSKGFSSSSSESSDQPNNLHLPRTKSISLTCSDSAYHRPNHTPPKPKKSAVTKSPPIQDLEVLLRNDSLLFSSSGFGDQPSTVTCEARVPQTLAGGGGGVGILGGGGRRSGGGDDGNNNHGGQSTETYYLKMIEANPGNALLLGNYAKFLKEVKGDYDKAEEYCGRAILANPNDADALSFYADLIWITQKDSKRAETYFDQAVKTSPDDCYVLASYARFLWDAEDDDDEENEDQSQRGIDLSRSSDQQSTFFHGAGAPITA